MLLVGFNAGEVEMRASVTSALLIATFIAGSAYAADDNACAKMNGQERAACEKQHAMGQEKMHEKGMGGAMRGEGSKDKGEGANKSNADHGDHANHGAAKGKTK